MDKPQLAQHLGSLQTVPNVLSEGKVSLLLVISQDAECHLMDLRDVAAHSLLCPELESGILPQSLVPEHCNSIYPILGPISPVDLCLGRFYWYGLCSNPWASPKGSGPRNG